jgi:hypothetical protein
LVAADAPARDPAPSSAGRGRGRAVAVVGLAVAVGAVAALASTPGRAQAQRVAGEARVGAGYDSNPSLAADPGNRRLPQGGGRGRPTIPETLGDGVVRVGGWAGGTVADELVAGFARFELDGRVYGSGQALFWERLRVGGLLRLDVLTPRCALDGSRLDSSFADDAAWTLGGSCGARVALPWRFWLSADLRGAGRFFDVGQTDSLVGGILAAGWALDPLLVEVSFSALRRESDETRARRWELSPLVRVRVDTEHVGGELLYRYVAREFDMGARSGAEHVGRLTAWGMPLPWLGGYVELELGYAEGNPQALSYERLQIVGGLRLALDWRPEPAGLPEPEVEQGPARVEAGRVRFRFELPGATRVSVVGDFNGWDAASGALRRTGDGVFEGSFRVAPGRHAYSLLVDGEPRRPPGAERYASDGFGGENAIFVVPEP